MRDDDIISIDEWLSEATDSEVRECAEKVKKKMKLYLLLSLIPGVGAFTAGLAIFCYNTYNYIKTRGRSNGSNIIRIILSLWGFVIIPIVEVQVLARTNKLGAKVIGLDK